MSKKTIETTIKNQPFTPYTNASGHKIDLYYIIQMKGHYAEGWGSWSSPFHKQFDTEDIVVHMSANNYDDGSQLEFRVKAVVHMMHLYMTLEFLILEPSICWMNTRQVTIIAFKHSGLVIHCLHKQQLYPTIYNLQ